MSPPLLAVRDLHVAFPGAGGALPVVTGVSFDVHAGETVALVGESGAGKSITAMTILRLLPPSAQVHGSIRYRGTDLLSLPEPRMRQLRGNEIAVVFQDPTTALDPVFTVGSQLIESIRTHHPRTSRRVARARAAELLDLVGIRQSRHRLSAYPHELSGGMRQRVMVAIAIANQPRLLVADEPTTALDATIQAQVVEVLGRAREATGAAMLLITHDLGMVAGITDRVQVMYAGRLFEVADTHTIFRGSRNPYTRGLLASLPSRVAAHGGRLLPIPGQAPDVPPVEDACPFRSRCRHATRICDEAHPDLRRYAADPRHLTRCHHAETLPKHDVDVVEETSA